MPQHFMVPMCEHGHILPAQPTVKVAWHIGSIWWYCHEEPAELRCRVNLLHPESFLGQDLPAPLVSICLVPAGVWRLKPLWTLLRSLLQPVQHFIQLCQQKNGHCRPNMTLLNPNKAEDTNYSSRETAAELSPPRKRSDTKDTIWWPVARITVAAGSVTNWSAKEELW